MMRKLGLATIASVLALNIGLAMAQPSQGVINFNIKSQPVGRALNELAQQAGIQVVYSSDVVANLKSRELKGSYNIADALAKVLAGQGLAYEFINDTTVSISKAADPNGN